MVDFSHLPVGREGTAALIVAALGPVLAVSLVAIALIFSSVEQGIEFEAQRGLQVARGLFLQQVQRIAAGAGTLGQDGSAGRGARRQTSVATRFEGAQRITGEAAGGGSRSLWRLVAGGDQTHWAG